MQVAFLSVNCGLKVKPSWALLALMLLHDSRRAARMDDAGDLVLLEDQDRSLWNHAQIAQALPLMEESLRREGQGEGWRGPGPYAIQAAIAALHCQAASAKETDWPQILAMYDLLQRVQPSPVVALNRAVAVAMVHGTGPALAQMDELARQGDLKDYHLLHAARADLLRRAGDWAAAAGHYAQALKLVTHESERRFLEKRLAEVTAQAGTSLGGTGKPLL